MNGQSRYLISGDSGITIEFGKEISEDINLKIRAMVIRIVQSNIKGIIEIIPTYRSILVDYNPLEIGYEELKQRLMEIESSTDVGSLPPAEVIHIPVLYGGEMGSDIDVVASHNNITVDDVIAIHSEAYYLVYMLGFTPGFPYLGGMSSKIATPRLESPRTKIPKGSVGIAGSQTGIYPYESPGGWQLIGRTPIELFNPFTEPNALLKSGQYIKFEPIDQIAYGEILDAVKHGTYKVKKSQFGRTE